MSNLVRTNGTRNFLSPFDSIFDDFFSPSFFPSAPRQSTMHVDHINYDDKTELFFTVPGYTKDDISITVENDTLVVEGTVSEKSESRFAQNQFRKAYTVSSDLYDGDNIDAELKDGILTVTLPKLEKAQPKRIEVKIK